MGNQASSNTNLYIAPSHSKSRKEKMAVRRASVKRTARRAATRRARVPRAPKRRRTTRRVTRKRVTRRRAARKARIVYGSMRRVWSGTADKTKGGLTKKDLIQNKNGKVVSKKQSGRASKNFKKSGLGKWCAAMMKARKELGLTGFVACKKGTAYYKLTKKFYA